MERARAEEIVRGQLEVGPTADLGEINIRAHLRRKLGRQPRHDDLFAFLGGIRATVGQGGITVETSEQMLTGADIVRYLVRRDV